MSLENRIVSTAHRKFYPVKAVRGLLSYLYPRRLQMQVPWPETRHSEVSQAPHRSPWLCCLALYRLSLSQLHADWGWVSFKCCQPSNLFSFFAFSPFFFPPQYNNSSTQQTLRKCIMLTFQWVFSSVPTFLQQTEDKGDRASGCCDKGSRSCWPSKHVCSTTSFWAFRALHWSPCCWVVGAAVK